MIFVDLDPYNRASPMPAGFRPTYLGFRVEPIGVFTLNFKGLKRWHEGRWGIGNKPQYSRVYTKDPLTHLPSSHLLSPLETSSPNCKNAFRIQDVVCPYLNLHRYICVCADMFTCVLAYAYINRACLALGATGWLDAACEYAQNTASLLAHSLVW